MRQITRGKDTFVIVEDVPFNYIIADVIQPYTLNNITDDEKRALGIEDSSVAVYDKQQLHYAQIVGCLRAFNGIVKEDSSHADTGYLFQNLVKDLSDTEGLGKDENSLGEKSTPLLKLIYFLIIATQKGSDIVSKLLAYLNAPAVNSWLDTGNMFLSDKALLDTLFDAYYGLGDPVCEEVINNILNLINFVKEQSKQE